MVVDPKQAQIMLALKASPLDRIRLMKTLFLVWLRRGKPSAGPFTFEPYLYGPCSFALYATLREMESEGLIVQAPHTVYSRAPYYLTTKGQGLAAGLQADSTIEEVALWAAEQDFQSLLNQVYKEAPEFASRSVCR